uniref:Uncharacterized protein n=1 Tax=Arundo donax TaxID=35708 RepID=A0A0A9CG80_ARUDO
MRAVRCNQQNTHQVNRWYHNCRKMRDRERRARPRIAPGDCGVLFI